MMNDAKRHAREDEVEAKARKVFADIRAAGDAQKMILEALNTLPADDARRVRNYLQRTANQEKLLEVAALHRGYGGDLEATAAAILRELEFLMACGDEALRQSRKRSAKAGGHGRSAAEKTRLRERNARIYKAYDEAKASGVAPRDIPGKIAGRAGFPKARQIRNILKERQSAEHVTGTSE